ncbi:hypothetical protein BT69DRAFT_1344990, partial [Atractiella rhizophila]
MTSLVLPPPQKRRGPPSLNLSSVSAPQTPKPLVLQSQKSSTMVPYNPDENESSLSDFSDKSPNEISFVSAPTSPDVNSTTFSSTSSNTSSAPIPQLT